MNIKDLKKLVREALLEISLKEDRNDEIQKLETLINDIKTKIVEEFGIEIDSYDDPSAVLLKHRSPDEPDREWHKEHGELTSLVDKWEGYQKTLDQLNRIDPNRPSKGQRELAGTHTGNRAARIAKAMAKKGNAPAVAPAVATVAENKNASLKSILKELYELENSDVPSSSDKKRIFVLVGPPSVGKSSWIANTFTNRPYVINRDDIAEKVASSYGWTYDDMFVTPPPDAQIGEVDEKYGTVEAAPSWMTWAKTVFSKVQEANNRVNNEFEQRVAGAPESGQDIVVDMTNMNAGARKKALSAIAGRESDYEKIAVVFEFEGAEDVIQRVAHLRQEAAARMGKNKTIPPITFTRMFSSFSRPTAEEGFDKIVSVDNRELLRKLASESETSESAPSEPSANVTPVKESIYPKRWQRLANIIKD